MKIDQARKLAAREEIDYQFLLSALREYSRPRDKISEWLKSGDLVRIKKGLYVFGSNIAQRPYSLEILANLIYGPSAISLSYALSFYGLIPERVATITSITSKRYKIFSTAAGNFEYFYLHPKKYAIGIELHASAADKQFLIAIPEKALCDQMSITDSKLRLSEKKDIKTYLFSDLRIDEHGLKKMNVKKIIEINELYQNKNIEKLIRFLRKGKR